MTCYSTRQKRRVTIGGQQVTEQDWRGILAILTTVGYFMVVTIATFRYGFTETLVTIGFLSTPEMLVVSWYFKAKEDSR